MDPFNQLPCSLSLVWKERKKKKWWKGWTVKSRLGNELLVIYSGCRGCQCERGWPFINVRRVDGDGTQCEASHGPCAVAVLLQAVMLNVGLKLRHGFVAEMCSVPGRTPVLLVGIASNNLVTGANYR